MESRFLVIWSLTVIFYVSRAIEAAENQSTRSQVEKDILNNIFIVNKYHMYVRPDKNNGTTDEPLDIFVSLYILDLEIDTEKQECSIIMYFRQEWNDSRLTFRPQGKINVLSIHEASGFWTPDLFFVNEKFGRLHTLTKPNTFVRIYPSGSILYSQRVTVKFTCKMDLRRYPFDRQICNLPIESYGYTASDLMLKWKPDVTYGTAEPLEFHVFYSTSEDFIQMTDANYSRLELGIHVVRVAHFTLLHIYLPLAFLVVSSWITFWLQPSCRVSRLTISVVTTLTALIQLPSTNSILFSQYYLTGMDAWVGISCLLIFGALFENIHVMATQESLDQAQRNQIQKEVPPELSQTDKSTKIVSGKFLRKHSNTDGISKIIFPCFYILFNVIYFAYFLI